MAVKRTSVISFKPCPFRALFSIHVFTLIENIFK